MHSVQIRLPLPTALILSPLAGVPFKSCRDASVLVQAALPREDLGKSQESISWKSLVSLQAWEWFFLCFLYWFVLIQLSPG